MKLLLFSLLFLAAAAPAAVTTKPATRPTATPKQRFTLMNGAVRYVVPADFHEASRTDDEKHARYETDDGKCAITINVSPLDVAFPVHNDRTLEKFKTSVLNGMRKMLTDQGYELLYGPRSETDDRFLLHIRTRYQKEGTKTDELNAYRAAGIDILMVSTQVMSEDAREVKRWDEVGEDVCLSITVGPAVRKSPATRPAAR